MRRLVTDSAQVRIHHHLGCGPWFDLTVFLVTSCSETTPLMKNYRDVSCITVTVAPRLVKTGLTILKISYLHKQLFGKQL